MSVKYIIEGAEKAMDVNRTDDQAVRTMDEGTHDARITMLTNVQGYLIELLAQHQAEYTMRREFLQQNMAGASTTTAYDSLFSRQKAELDRLQSKLEDIKKELSVVRRNSHRPTDDDLQLPMGKMVMFSPLSPTIPDLSDWPPPGSPV